MSERTYYMQQRYYDPIAGRFLSTDPVTTDEETGESFNRYVYAENNPYKYTDPDGRDAWAKEPPPPPPTVLPAVTITAPAPTQLPRVTITAPRITAPSISPAAGLMVMRMGVPLGLLTFPSSLGAPPCEMAGGGACGMRSEAKSDATDDAPPEAGRKKDKGKDDEDAKGGHTKGKRNSTKDKHEKGDERRGRDQGGEKKDDRMKY